MEALIQWMTGSASGEFFYTMLMSMVPVVELRGGIPFGVALGLDIWPAYVAAVIGNMLPVPFIIIFIRRIFQWMRVHMPRLNSLVDKLEQKAHLKGRTVTKYRYLGLMIFVAIPLPGTGAWTGSLVAAFLDMRLRKALPVVFLGVLIAGVLISAITFGVTSLL
jgi:uncharacterized membrane protein